MAWSEAARRAAAEVRRQHLISKGLARPKVINASVFDRKLMADSGTRSRIARHLRAFRKGGKAAGVSKKLGYSVSEVTTEARASTIVRNLLRRKPHASRYRAS